MKNLIYSFTIFLIFNVSYTSYSQTGWSQLPAPSATGHLYGIYFKDVSTGITSRYRTTDGGQTWATFNHNGYAMTFADQNSGYIVGVSGIIYKTTNTGINWTLQNSATENNTYGVCFPSISTGYACADGATIIKTTNGGTNWILLTSPISSSYFLSGIYFTDVNTGYICGNLSSDFSSVILKTTNSGANWSVQNFTASTGYYSIFFVNASTGIAIGEKAAKTTDAGATWIEKTQNVTTFQHCLFFSSINNGCSVGLGGNIIKTSDGGETWFRQTSATGSPLESVYFINDNTGFVCGDGGVVLKTTDGGGPPIGITPVSTEVPNGFSLSQNYPNPFNPSTKLNFSLPKKSFAKIVIYDAAGQMIEEIVNFELNAGTYSVDWNASNYPSGVYFYSLIAGDYKESKKMILVK